MAMIKKISRRKAISQIPVKTIVEGQRAECRFCGDEITNKEVVDGIIVCSNPKCPSHRKKEGS